MAAIVDNPPPTELSVLSHIDQLTFPKKSPKRWREMVKDPLFYIAKFKLTDSVDPMTRRWIRNGADEKAAALGMRYNEKKGQYPVDWIQRYCRLYEGDKAGLMMDIDDWQYEYFMQVFGWQTYDEEIVNWRTGEVGGWRRRYKRASVWIPKKNAKSPTLAATGLYMLIGDGEMGQKCYAVARDGKQALIAHTHSMLMVEASEELNNECKVHKATGLIHHLPTHSKFSVVSGDNPLSTEGYNGSLFVDETHVVDEPLIMRLKRAGISRKEPLHIEMSTAGASIDGYGYDQWEKGRKNQDGGPKCQLDLYFLEFGVDQATPIEFYRSPEKVKSICRQVNPTIGRILRTNEFMEDYTKSQETEKDLREFAMYRTNKWMTSAETWIALDDWQMCGEKYLFRWLVESGFPCTAGLDLSKTRDMTSLTLCFGVPDEEFGILPHLWTWVWWPRDQARKFSAKQDFDEFRPALTLVENRAINYEVIADKLNHFRDTLDFRGMAFDPYNSDQLVSILENEHGWAEDQLMSVKQTMPYMGPLSREFERMVLLKQLRYCSKQKILDWQIGHCYTIGDQYGNLRPIKEGPDSYKKIDCVVSQILALAKFNNDPTLASGYSDSIILMNAMEAQKQREELAANRDIYRKKSSRDY